MTDEERAAAMAALDHASGFRFVYWMGDGKAQRYTVERDWDDRSDNWGVFEGDVAAWTGESWEWISRVPAAYRWTLTEALRIAEKLAFEHNQHIIATLEKLHPGDFKGGEFDLAATRTGAPITMADIQRRQRQGIARKYLENEQADRKV